MAGFFLLAAGCLASVDEYLYTVYLNSIHEISMYQARLARQVLPQPGLASAHARRAVPLPEGVWQGHHLATAGQAVQPTGHAVLDAALPGGGWPLGAMTDVLWPAGGPETLPGATPQWPLVLPALAGRVAQRDGLVMLVNPPHEPMAAALAAAGLPADRWCRVSPQTPGQAWWACEQALRCEGVVAVLAWLPHAPAAVLRRLHLAAAMHQPLLWVFRPEGKASTAAQQASPAPLRLRLQTPTPEVLQVQILKRRGAPLEAPLSLPGGAAPWLQLLQAQSQRMQSVRAATAEEGAAHAGAAHALHRRSHALDRLAMAQD